MPIAQGRKREASRIGQRMPANWFGSHNDNSFVPSMKVRPEAPSDCLMVTAT
jgi:hypothetical protein